MSLENVQSYAIYNSQKANKEYKKKQKQMHETSYCTSIYWELHW